MQICIVATWVFVCISCGEDEPDLPTPPAVENTEGEISFDINIPKGDGNETGGTGTTSSPIVADKGKTVDIVIEQKSSYTDPDGTVITCEPKAEIQLFAKQDTVYAKDLKALTEVKPESDIQNSTSGTYPINTQTLQTFTIGGQEVVFDLSYEIYRISNSEQQQIEMPYIKLNPANFGNSGATESEVQGRSAVMTGVTVRPLAPATRGETITTETAYEVNVQFSMDIESVNTKSDDKKTLSFAVNYVGVVETTTELADPVSTLSYEWDVKSGSYSTSSPFVKEPKQAMELWLKQNSSYTDAYSNVATSEPKAVIKLDVSQDTVWAATVDELTNIAYLTGDIAPDVSARQQFGSDLQSITFDWSYEKPEAVLAEQNIVLPYYELSPITLKEVTATEIPDALITGKQADVYEITAVFSQTMTAKELTSGSVEETIEYQVSYIGAVEVSLVSVNYRKGFEWLEAHDNMPLLSHVIVYRDRTYSNGQTYTDVFTSMNCAIDKTSRTLGHTGELNEVLAELDNGECIYYKTYPVIHTDYTSEHSSSTGVPDINRVSELWFINDDCTTHEADGNNLDEYKNTDAGVYYNEDAPVDGWYFDDIRHRYKKRYTYDGQVFTLRTYSIETGFYDRFLCIDDTIIDFREWNMTREFDFRVVDLPETETRGPAKVHIMDCKARYLERDFYWCVTDTIYQIKK